AAGIRRMIFVNHPSKSATERYVRHDHDLCETLRSRGKHEIADQLKEMAEAEHEEIVFVMQEVPLGLGHAVLQAREAADGGPVAVLLPDDLILGEHGCLSEMVEAWRQTGGHLVAAMETPRAEVSSYGVLDPIERRGPVTRARGMVEKPAPQDAPSTLAVVGRYVLDAGIFEALAKTTPGAGGEIQLTDAMAADAARCGLAGFEFSGLRFDCGNRSGMLAATVHRAELLGEAPAAKIAAE
ncbi:MAG: sugar phosphate nucleotidyltransferase, partial [Pseudomonadota bacterium]